MEQGAVGNQTWCELSSDPLDPAAIHDWAVRPDCGAVVVFTGTVREFADGRSGVQGLEYEAYAEHVVPRLEAIAAEARVRWGDLGRIALVHRIGALVLTEAAVVVAVSAAHRGEAFEAARFCIDALKATVPIWKRERWEDGEDWGTRSFAVRDVDEVTPR